MFNEYPIFTTSTQITILWSDLSRPFWEDVEAGQGRFTLTPLYSGAGSPRCQVLPGGLAAAAVSQHPLSLSLKFHGFHLGTLTRWDVALVDFQQNMPTWESAYPFMPLRLIETIARTTQLRLTAQKIEKHIYWDANDKNFSLLDLKAEALIRNGWDPHEPLYQPARHFVIYNVSSFISRLVKPGCLLQWIGEYSKTGCMICIDMSWYVLICLDMYVLMCMCVCM